MEQELTDVKLLQMFSGIDISQPMSHARQAKYEGLNRCRAWFESNQFSPAQHFEAVCQWLW
jgi:hypothetical protein